MSTERYRPMRRLGPGEVTVGTGFRSAAGINLLADHAVLRVTEPARLRNDRRTAGILHPEAAAAAFANA